MEVLFNNIFEIDSASTIGLHTTEIPAVDTYCGSHPIVQEQPALANITPPLNNDCTPPIQDPHSIQHFESSIVTPRGNEPQVSGNQSRL